MADPIEFGTKLFPVAIYGFDNNPENLIYIDASINEGHQIRAEITQHPVEFGANVSDHGIIQPRNFSLSGLVSSVDLNNRADLLSGSQYRGYTAWQILRAAVQQKTALTIETNLEIYTTFLISELRTDQNWRNSLSLEFTATFQEVLISTTDTVRVDAVNVLDGSTSEQYSSQIDRGVVSAEQFTED